MFLLLLILLVSPSSFASTIGRIQRIVGGKPAPFIQFHARAIYPSSCSGTFISPNHIIVAGYCVYKRSEKELWWPSPTWKWMTGTNTSGMVITAKRTFVHPSFQSGLQPANEQNLAIMELESSNNADGSFVSIGSVPDDNSSFVVAGFGDTGNGVYSNELLFIRQQLVNRTICEGRLRLNIGPQASLRESEFCLAPVQGESGTDTCYGDAGVPVLKQLNGSFVLVGVGLGGTSRVCAAPNDYGTYVFVQGSQDWIQSVLNGSFPATEEVVPLETRVIGSFILVYIFCGAMFIVAIIFSVNQLVAMRWIECLGCFLVAGFAIVRVIVAALYQASPISYDVISCLSQTTGIWIIWAYGCVLLMWIRIRSTTKPWGLLPQLLLSFGGGVVVLIAYFCFLGLYWQNIRFGINTWYSSIMAAMVVYYALLIIILALRTLHQMNKMKRSIGSSLQLTKRQNQVRKVAFHVLIVAFAALLGIIVLVIGAIGSQLQFWPSAYYSRWVNDCFISALVPMLTCVPILFVFRPHLKCCKPKQRENQAPLTTNSTTKLKELSTDGTLEEMFEKNTMEINNNNLKEEIHSEKFP